MSDPHSGPPADAGVLCLDSDEVVALVVALGEAPASKLVHALGCEECRARVETVARLRDPLYVGEASPEGRADSERFLATFDASAALRSKPAAGDLARVLTRVGTAFAAAVTAVSATLLISARAVDVSPLGGLTAALLGVLALVATEGYRRAGLGA